MAGIALAIYKPKLARCTTRCMRNCKQAKTGAHSARSPHRNENLDIRTITMGISLIDCADSDINKSCEKIHKKILKYAGKLVETGEMIEAKYGIPIINKRISVTRFPF